MSSNGKRTLTPEELELTPSEPLGRDLQRAERAVDGGRREMDKSVELLNEIPHHLERIVDEMGPPPGEWRRRKLRLVDSEEAS
jgi:hypothetical protein